MPDYKYPHNKETQILTIFLYLQSSVISFSIRDYHITTTVTYLLNGLNGGTVLQKTMEAFILFALSIDPLFRNFRTSNRWCIIKYIEPLSPRGCDHTHHKLTTIRSTGYL